MKRLRILIFVFCLALSVPLGYFVVKTYKSLEREELAQLQYFADALFDGIEHDLAVLVQEEEERGIDAYYARGKIFGENQDLSHLFASDFGLQEKSFFIGYLQNNPDGSFQTPNILNHHGKDLSGQSDIAQLKEVNRVLNQKRTTDPDGIVPQPVNPQDVFKGKKEQGFADRYLNLSRSDQKIRLGQERKRVAQITIQQALNLSRDDPLPEMKDSQSDKTVSKKHRSREVISQFSLTFSRPSAEENDSVSGRGLLNEDKENSPSPSSMPDLITRLQVEFDPLQSILIDDQKIFIFRRVMIANKIYRQGFVIRMPEFVKFLADTYFLTQPMAQFTRLTLNVKDSRRNIVTAAVGAPAQNPIFRLERTFPRPFSFLNATLTCERIPRTEGRKTLNIMIGVLGTIIMVGLFAIYRSAWLVMDISERRSRFVSSVTHELKTPLTNIRMYIEMLEQGMATTPEREQEYFRILSSESGRLSRLISNVLEFSKLEKKKLKMNLIEGTFEEVIDEARSIMREKLRKEGFTLEVDHQQVAPFLYDREVMIQVLINLMENSMKFGKDAPQRHIRLQISTEKKRIVIRHSDTGPGIPKRALKKVFDDFYRGDDSTTRTTRGTGIGLAFVRKVVTTIGGTVSAQNNDGPGCTITLSLPARHRANGSENLT